MEIPQNCQDWREQLLRGSPAHRHVVETLEGDNCVSAAVCEEFFRYIASNRPYSSPQSAFATAASRIVDSNDPLTCGGSSVPEGDFVRLVRIQRLSDIRFCGPRITELLQRAGVADHELESMPIELVMHLVDNYRGSVLLGNKFGIVWVTDGNSCAGVGLGSLAARLGIEISPRERYIECAYNRTDCKTSLHVPRAFDALDQAMFLPNSDCSAASGLTRPLAPETTGLPEAVHRASEVNPTTWRLWR